LIKANSPYNNGITYTTRYPIGLTYSNQFDNFPLYASLPGYGQLTRHDAIFEQDSLTIDFHWSRPGHDGSSAATPVIIEGFFINAEGADFGVRFWSSTLYVLLRNCIIVNAKTGVEMWACQNIKVQNCLIVDHEVQGIFVSYSDYCTAEGNTLRNIGPYAIYVAESDFATITGNIIDMSYATSGTSAINIGNCNDPLISSNVIDLGAYVTVGISIGSYSSSTNTRIIGNSITSSNVYTIGIDIHDVPTVTIQKNIITGIGTGISMNGVTSPVGSASLIGGATEDLGNTISGNSIAMVIQYCTRITIAWNTFGNNDRAIFKYSSSGIVVENNNIITGTYSDGSYAISDPDGGNITITGNYIKGYETGIIINGVSNVSISNNTIDSCVVAIMCTGADLITIQENVLVNNTGYGVVIQANVTNATIAGNQFLNNNNGNVQASDDAGGNTWTGNYWSDFEARYPNATSTYGVWDVPYTLDGASNTTDATAIVNVGGVDETGEFLDTMEFMFDDLAASISTNLTGFKKWICLVLAYRAATIVQSMVEDHENGDPISVMDLALLTIITRVIQVIACKPGISAICNNITMAIANFAETNGIS
nr:NosD domain-containing protein [Candidatus Sigynarchaeota archaeon]